MEGRGYLGTLFCVLMTLGASQKACLGDSIDMNLSLCAVKEDLRKMKAVSGLTSEKNEELLIL